MLYTSPILEAYSIQPDEYFDNINTYTFQKIILLNNGYQFESMLTNDVKASIENPFMDLNTNYRYILFEEIQLLKEHYWDMEKRMDFLFNLVELIDVDEKFAFLKKIYNHNGPYIIKVRKALRNIGVHPILDSNLSVVKECTTDLSWADLLKYYD